MGDEHHTAADRDVLFFGCVAVTLTGMHVNGDALPETVRKNSSGKLRVRATVVPVAGANTEERLGECVDSAEYPLQSADLAEDLFIPIMLERASSTAAPIAATNKRRSGVNDEDAPRAQLVLDISIAHRCTSWGVVRRTLMMESLAAVSSHNCGVASARVAAAAFCSQAIDVPAQGGTTSVGGSSLGCSGIECSGVELHFVVRALDLSIPIRAMLNAESEARALLRLPQDKPRMLFTFPPQQLPYGALPLDVMYRAYRCFCEQLLNRLLKSSEHVLQILRGAQNATASCSSGGWRWSALCAVDLRPTLLGDDALIPVLATLFHCPSLCSLLLDQNSVGDMTCYRLSALFHRHRHLQELSICRNEVHESGAEQLLRLARRNKQITRLHVTGNPCSANMLDRMGRVTSLNREALESHPFNVFSASYVCAAVPTSFPSFLVTKALAVWAMLSAAPMSPTTNSTIATECTINTSNAAAGVSASTRIADEKDKDGGDNDDDVRREEDMVNEGGRTMSIIPCCAFAPLLNEVMCSVALHMSSLLEDPCIRIVFTDIEHHRRRVISATQGSDKCAGSLRGTVDKMDTGGGVCDDNKREEEKEEGETPENGENAVEQQWWVSRVDLEEVYRCSFLHIVVATMRGIARAADWVESAAVLRDIGRRQKEMGVMPADYRDALHAFVRSLNKTCGTDQVDVEHSVAFLQCLALGVRTALGL